MTILSDRQDNIHEESKYHLALKIIGDQVPSDLWVASYKVMPFGKYAGRKLGEVPLRYLDTTISIMPQNYFVRFVQQFVADSIKWLDEIVSTKTIWSIPEDVPMPRIVEVLQSAIETFNIPGNSLVFLFGELVTALADLKEIKKHER